MRRPLARGARAVAAMVATAMVLAPTVAGAQRTKRALAVVEYRAGSAALPGVATRLATEIGRLTSLAVSSPDQARAIYGDGLDAKVVACDGDGACIAGLGARLGADEILLVGVSEIGDVVLTLQRITVTSRRVESRMAESLRVGVTPSDLALDQYLTRVLPPADFLRFGVIDIVADLKGAKVAIGGELRGLTPLVPVKVKAPATYDIRVEKRGFVPFSAEVEVPPDGVVKVNASLTAARSRAWYDRWWVVALGGVIVAGAAGSAIYFATNRGDGSLSLGGVIE